MIYAVNGCQKHGLGNKSTTSAGLKAWGFWFRMMGQILFNDGLLCRFI